MEFMILALATWRVTALLVYGDWFLWLRTRAKVHIVDEAGEPTTATGRVLACFWCASIFVGAMFGGLCGWGTVAGRIVLSLALSGAATLLNHFSRIYRDHG